jgi:prepilin-type processing-associated H-X9-DG protein
MASEPSRNGPRQRIFTPRTIIRIVLSSAIASLVIVGFQHVMGLRVALPAACAFLFVWFAIEGRPLLTFIALGLAGFELLIPATELAHEASRKQQCVNNLHQIGLALLNYENSHGRFPQAFLTDKAGTPLLSWRVLVLDDLNAKSLLDQIDRSQPWNAPKNSALAIPYFLFSCPDDNYGQNASYLAVVGSNTAWPGATGRKLSEIKNPSKTILVIEVANSGINWAEPRDLTIAQVAQGLNPKNGLGPSSHHPGGVNVLFADGHVEFLPEDIDPKELARMCDINPPDDPAAASRGEK